MSPSLSLPLYFSLYLSLYSFFSLSIYIFLSLSIFPFLHLILHLSLSLSTSLSLYFSISHLCAFYIWSAYNCSFSWPQKKDLAGQHRNMIKNRNNNVDEKRLMDRERIRVLAGRKRRIKKSGTGLSNKKGERGEKKEVLEWKFRRLWK